MADWSDTSPQETTPYTQVLPALRDRDKDAAMMAESPTNPPIGYKRWNTAASKLQVWNGASWDDLILSLAGGGTGAIDAASARTALGLGSMAVQNNNAVSITGGIISGLTSLGVSGNTILSGSITVAGAGIFTGNSLGWFIASGSIIFSELGASVGPSLNIRPAASKRGYLSFTENTIADRWFIGIEPADASLYFRAGLYTGTSVLTLTPTISVMQIGSNFLAVAAAGITLGAVGVGISTINGNSIALTAASSVAVTGSSFGVNTTDITLTASATVSITGPTIDITGSGGLNLLSNNIGISSLVATGVGTDLVKNASGDMVLKSSSIRYKENVGDFKLNTRQFMAVLSPVRFDYIKSDKNIRGFIAEEIYANYPELINLNDKGQPESIRTDSLIAYMFYTMRSMYGRLMEIDNHLFSNSPLG